MRRRQRSSLATLACLAIACSPSAPPQPPRRQPELQTVFVIVMENQNWSSISGSSSAPYLNGTLLPMGAHATQYFNPPGNHPSLPNYLWMVAGQSFGIRNDDDPAANSQSSTAHLAHLLEANGIPWKTYQEDIPGDSCPLTRANQYAPKHDPFVYFDDLTDQGSPSSATCLAHVRPLSELPSDLDSGRTPQFAFITPNLCNDMHDCGIRAGDDWLAQWMPKLLASSAYQQNGAVFIVWDEGVGGDGPIGLIALSPLARSGYASGFRYSHSSLLRTIEEALALTPLLGDAANATNMGDLFEQ